jgi:diacylglycerol kinase family enzyme
VNGEHFAVMAGAGLDAMMIRSADAGLKDKVGRIAYVWTGVKNVQLEPVRMSIEVDGRSWFEDEASASSWGTFGTCSVGYPSSAAVPDDGRLDIGVVTADGAWEWSRTLGRAVVGDVSASPFVRTTTGHTFKVRLKRPLPYELDGGDRKRTKKLKISVQPRAITVCVPEEGRG